MTNLTSSAKRRTPEGGFLFVEESKTESFAGEIRTFEKIKYTESIMEVKKALGVDIGNVIIDYRLVDFNDKNLLQQQYYSNIPSCPGVFECLKILNDHFNGEVYLISKCAKWLQEKILRWLSDNDFYTKTGIDPKHIYFIDVDLEKDVTCKQLNITHFIDDNLTILSHLIDLVPHLFLFQPDNNKVKESEEFLSHVTTVAHWNEVMNLIISRHNTPSLPSHTKL